MPINKLLENISDCCKSTGGLFKFTRGESHTNSIQILMIRNVPNYESFKFQDQVTEKT